MAKEKESCTVLIIDFIIMDDRVQKSLTSDRYFIELTPAFLGYQKACLCQSIRYAATRATDD